MPRLCRVLLVLIIHACARSQVIDEVVGLLKKEVNDMFYLCNTVKMWIQLNIPRIEADGNFGVSVQEETVSELGRAEDSGIGVMDAVSKYYVSRAKVLSKVRTLTLCGWGGS